MAKSKYVHLLNKTFDKYKDIETIVVSPRTSANETGAQHEKIMPLRRTVTESDGERKNKSKGVKEKKNRKYYKQKQFSPEEDEVLRNAIQIGDINFVEIAKEMARDQSSIRKRVRKLNSSGSSRHKKLFQFQEDCVLIDAAIQDLLKCNSLEITKIPDVDLVSASLNREANSTVFRWEHQLRHWLLRYYNKTLNLEIRPMLANVLAENFSSIEEIDWNLVSKYPEFSGFTVPLLRVEFYAKILPSASRRLKIDKFNLTLKQISEDAEATYKHARVNSKVEQRKRDIIEYFEKTVKDFDIKDFV